MRWLQILVQYIAVSILLIHSFIPHTHHSGMSFEEDQTEHQKADGIIDLLALVFHYDHQEEQLEDYTIVQNDLNSDGIQVLDVDTFSHEKFVFAEYKNGTQNFIYLSPLLASTVDRPPSLRAPPTIS